MSRPLWFPDWSGKICAIIASGESAKEAPIELLRDCVRVMAINRSYELAPWADVLYGGDRNFWEQYPQALDFKGLKITSNRDAAKRFGIEFVDHLTETDPKAHDMVFDRPGTVGHGGHSGFKGVNCAAQFSPRAILLIGFDLIGEHWHDKHQQPLGNPRQAAMDVWRARLDAQAAALKTAGIEVVNCSASSALSAYRKLDIVSALRELA